MKISLGMSLRLSGNSPKINVQQLWLRSCWLRALETMKAACLRIPLDSGSNFPFADSVLVCGRE